MVRVVFIYGGLVGETFPDRALEQIDAGQVPGVTPDERVRQLVRDPAYEEALDGASLVLEAVTPRRPNYVLLEVDDDRAQTLFEQVEPVAARRGLMTHLGVVR